MLPAQAPPPYSVSPLASGPFVGDVPHISTQPHLQQWHPGAATQSDALQPPPAAAAAAAPPPPGPPVAPFPFGMCMGAPQGPPGGLKGGPEAPAGGGPWQPMQQQHQQHQQHQHQQPQPQQQRAPQQPPQQPHVSALQPPGGVYAPMGLGGAAMPKGESKSSRPPKGGGACRRKADSGVEGGGPPAPSSGTRPAKFFKQHSPGKGAPKPRAKGCGVQGIAQEDGMPKDPALVPVGCQGGPPGGPPSHGAPVRQPPLSGHCKPPSSGTFEKGEGNGGAPRPNPRPRAVRPSEVMAKMYFHRKKEAWRAELLIEGTKKQKSFSCRLYGYERARLMCEWARKFVLRTSRLPTDEETCTSLASLMKEPLPPQVPTSLPYGRSEGTAAGPPGGAPGGAPGGTPGGTQAPLPSAGEASQGKTPAEQRDQPPAATATAPVGAPAAPGAGGVAAREAPYGGDVGGLPGAKSPLEPRVSPAGVCKKRKEAAKCGEGTTKVRKGSDCPGGASSKKGQAPRGAPEGPAEAALQGPRRVARTDLLVDSPNGKPAAPGENRAEGTAPVMSPYLSFKNVEATNSAYNGAVGPQPVGGPGQEMPLAECPAPCLPGGAPRTGASEELQGKPNEMSFRGPETCGGEALSPSANPWFEELEQLKKISRPKGGRAKRFNDEKDMKSQFELARSFLRQVIDKGRQLHDSDGEGLSEDEPAWLVRGNSSTKWTCKKDAGTICAKTEQQHRPKSPPGQQARRRPPSLSNKGPRVGLPTDAVRCPLVGSPGDCQGPCGVGPYFVHGGPMQGDGGQGLSRCLPTSASGNSFAPKDPGEAPAWLQRAAGEGDSGEIPEEETGAEPQGSSKAEGAIPWGPSFPEAADVETAGNRPPGLQLQLPLMQCRGVFTTADSPMCGRPSPKERSPFSTEATTGFFSAVTTTADEALPVSSNSASEGLPGAPGPCPSKSSGGLYAASYFCCQPFVAPTEGRGSTAPANVSRAPEGAPMMPLSTNPSMQEADMSMSHGEFAPPNHEGPAGTLPPTLPYPVGGPPPTAAPITLFHPADGTPKSPESFLQFRPFVEQPTAQLETSLGEELLSVAGYSCGFGFPADNTLSSKQQINQNSPLLPNRQPNGMVLLPGHDPAMGAAKGASFGPPGGPWALASPLTLHKSKEEARTRNMAGAPDKTDPVGPGAPCRARNEAGAPRPPAPLPWVVVRPREDEEKALTPLAGKASGYLLQGPPMGCTYIPHHAN
ncbi:hypothetical protein, conserved [Eimeria praecox]|uniref:Uncharacterized protein n=1 Tax=Eimeria praecox TaxID=51316 RepID=U6G7F4_9EIME|nr:hypothetical protein, conserved [Eimeria praecox]